jgi:hypothetical protein
MLIRAEMEGNSVDINLESIQDPIFDKKLHQVSADLKQYRINQLKRMEQTNSTLLVEYLYSRMRE